MIKNKGDEVFNSLYNEYIFNRDLSSVNNVMNKIELLIENKLAVKITDMYDTWENRSLMSASDARITSYNVISYYMCKKDKKLKDYLEIIDNGEDAPIFIDDDVNEKIFEYTKYQLSPGIYSVELKDNNFAVLHSQKSEKTEEIYNFSFYFIGDKCIKNNKKFLQLQSEIFKLNPDYNKTRQMILYSNSGRFQYTKFKNFNSLILKDKDRIIKYIDNWIDSVPLLYSKGIMPKLSILLYGKPGTGKSTFYKALADHLNITTVVCLPPERFYSDKNHDKANRIYHDIVGKIYAIDDIDCVCQSREDNSNANNTRVMSSLLEFLDNPPVFYYKMKDGIYYPISIIVATTNYYDKLDEAVKRYGRFDFQLKLDNFNKKEAEEMCKTFDLTLSDIFSNKEITDKFEISPAKLQALCMENINRSVKGSI